MVLAITRPCAVIGLVYVGLLQAGRDDKRKGISFASELKKLTKSSKQYRGFITPPLQASPEGTHSKDEKGACSLTFSDTME